MATKNTPIPFTVGDQERLVAIEKELQTMPEKIATAVGNIQITHTCDKVHRIESLENTRDKWYSGMRTGAVSVIVASLLGVLAWLGAKLGVHIDGM
jgi:hypothetical protein